ncbi:agmatine deiminase family protein [Roseobacter sp. HKCCD9010]|nr:MULTISPECIES: agmatine deiminase family protein [unclassified Roseobacter]MBF9051517.1 agmatine deiminase family protein [Rhodobacterales bacterium HKCCD4356]NNV39678.1 agmatine deiminase family protein [Roseobacter sp. HKCCD9054]NNV48064.1 agmatine deiminase family protein [Roseobacter sp. HKCCD6265]NNV78290.1 agmatine deiminase family protein [Roseobacter sp. HKCCD6135]NNV86550.1 agmatine deiminase family protein [Roseobacter sp. HKCCD8414]NNW93097.1 agmatine deiminase family protein [Ro
MQRRVFLASGVAAGLLGRYALGDEVVRANGFWMPEEAEPHQRSFMQWPVNREVHPDRVFLEMLQQSIADIANAIADFEPVVMLMEARFAPQARRMLSDAVEIWDIPTDDLWCRDSGPVFLRNAAGDLAVAQLNFNGWGGKQTHAHDGEIAARVADRLGLPLIESGVVGEAGGLESDGDGTLIAHESSWVIDNRNPGLSREEIEARLLSVLGARKMIWAPGVVGADITDYHIDSLARFSEPGKVVIQMPEAPRRGDPWSRAAFETYDILAAATDAEGRPLEMVVIPEPWDTRVTSDDFVASYVNYYVCNGAVIAAQFGDAETDAEAEATLARLYPGREIVMLEVDPVGEVGGGIHCATQQMPAV